MLGKQSADSVLHIVGHVIVDVIGQLDESEVLSEVFSNPPSQITRIDWKAVTADSWSRCEAHEPKRLGRCSVDCSPDVDVESSCKLCQFIDERDVDVSERVLKQFDNFGFSAVRHGNGPIHQAGEKRVDSLERLSSIPGDHFRCVFKRIVGITWVDSLRGIAEEKTISTQTRFPFKDRRHEFLGGTRIRRRLEHDASPLLKTAPDRYGRGLDETHVREPIREWSWDADHRNIERVQVALVLRR